MNFSSDNAHHSWWVFPAAFAFGLGIAALMGVPMGRQVSKAFSPCPQQNCNSKSPQQQ